MWSDRSRQKFVAFSCVLILLSVASCTSIETTSPDEISIDTGDVGNIVPGIRGWMSWFEANEHCSAQSKDAELADLRGTIAVYRCVPRK
jgi:hypothetical protein